MTSKQTNKKNMFNKLLVFFALPANAAIWATFTALANKIAHFVDLNDFIDQAAQLQSGTTTGITDNKTKLRIKMTTLLVRNARKARVWAHDKDNSDLETVFNVQKDDFLEGKETEVISHARIIQQALEDNATNLATVNVKAQDITDSKNNIDQFEASLGTTGVAEGKKKTGTEGLTILFEQADTTLDLIDDLLINEYQETNAEMVLEYRNNRKIDDIGVHHTGLLATLVYSGTQTAVQGVTVTIVELKKTAVSDINGLAKIIKCKPGEYHVTFTGTGIVPQTMVVKMPRGHIVKLTVEVVKQ